MEINIVLAMSKIYHKFDPILDKCTICGVLKKKEPYVGSGYNAMLKNKFTIFYSVDDGKTWSKEFINCKK